ncbi:MAG: hypothetical protein WD691_02585 [Acidimicrobiales bacterium]
MRSPFHLPRRTVRLGLTGAIALLLITGAESGGAAELPTTSVSLPVPLLGITLDGPQASTASQATAGQLLVGTFAITAGTCSGTVAGSYFQMIQPGGTASGPFVSNGDSPCSNNTFTPMAPGTDGGLITGSYQPSPTPAFDGSGNGLAGRVTKPQRFFGVDFASATNPTDPQTGTKVTAPTITVDAEGRLGGDLRAFAATWNGQHFNQGAPKPDGSTSGATALPTGTYDAATGAFVLDWTSRIEGGPFNSFAGRWHFEGTFTGSQTAEPPSGATGRDSVTDPAAVASGGGAASGPGSAGGSLANTGASVATGRALLLLAAGLAGIGILRQHRWIASMPTRARG